MAKFRITNYGNTRKLPCKGVYYEITKNGFIETNDADLAKALGEFLYIDVEVIEAPVKKKKKKKTKSKKKKPSERKVAAKKRSKKTKRCKRKKLKGN